MINAWSCAQDMPDGAPEQRTKSVLAATCPSLKLQLAVEWRTCQKRWVVLCRLALTLSQALVTLLFQPGCCWTVARHAPVAMLCALLRILTHGVRLCEDAISRLAALMPPDDADQILVSAVQDFKHCKSWARWILGLARGMMKMLILPILEPRSWTRLCRVMDGSSGTTQAAAAGEMLRYTLEPRTRLLAPRTGQTYHGWSSPSAIHASTTSLCWKFMSVEKKCNERGLDCINKQHLDKIRLRPFDVQKGFRKQGQVPNMKTKHHQNPSCNRKSLLRKYKSIAKLARLIAVGLIERMAQLHCETM